MELKTNHFVRIVKLITDADVLCLLGDIRGDNNEVVGYRMVYPYTLGLGELDEKGNMSVTHDRFCPFSPIEEHRISGAHIISVVFPDNSVLDNYVAKLTQLGVPNDAIFPKEEETTETTEEVLNGDISKLTETGE